MVLEVIIQPALLPHVRRTGENGREEWCWKESVLALRKSMGLAKRTRRRNGVGRNGDRRYVE